MFQKLFLSIGLALIVGAQESHAQACKDISTVWTLSSTFVDGTTATRIYSDGQSYADGLKGVAADIKICSSGTYDAVLSVSSGRTIMFNFAAAFLGTAGSAPPAWTSGAPFASTPTTVKNCAGSPCTLLNIRNILNSGTADRSQYYLLYTKLASGFVAPDKTKYFLSMENPATSGVAPTPNLTTANSPYLNSRVVVEHYPAIGAQKEYWLVYPELPTSTGSQSPSPENAVIFSQDHTVNFGQFSLPFFIRIEVK